MPLLLKLVSEHRELVGDDAEREFSEAGGTIGRALENDWILPDPDRYISGRHATIDYKGGIYYLLDTSSNGVYINDEVEPIGKGNPRRLFDGDRMRMGDFEFTVSVDSGESLEMPIDDEPPSVAPDNIEQFVDEEVLATGIAMLEEEAMTGEKELQNAIFGEPPEETGEYPEEPADEVTLEPPPAANDEGPAVEESAPPDIESEALFAAFLDGVGISRQDLHSSVDVTEMMMTAGVVLREFVDGVINLLMSRANLKNAFRLEQTTVMPRQNNPLKFSVGSPDLVKQLLIGGEGEYLGAQDAVREVCRDLLDHQNAFLDAMTAAFIDFADRFDPEELKEGFERTLSSGKLTSFMNKSKYWDLYCDLYPIITETGGGRFPQMFGEEFVRAYERQVAEYQRKAREGLTETGSYGPAVDPGLLKTQKLDNPSGAEPLDVESQHTEPPAEAAFEDDDIVDVLATGDKPDAEQGFIDELDNTLSRELQQDQLRKA